MLKLLLSLLALIYVLYPCDLFPDIIIGWGWLDDIAVLYFLWKFFYASKNTKHYNKSFYQKNRQAFEQKNNDRSSQKNGQGKNYQFREKTTKKDPYSVLGVDKDAGREEIKRAYLQLANKYHPDKVLHLGEEFRNLAEERFKEIQAAYQELSK